MRLIGFVSNSLNAYFSGSSFSVLEQDPMVLINIGSYYVVLALEGTYILTMENFLCFT